MVPIVWICAEPNISMEGKGRGGNGIIRYTNGTNGTYISIAKRYGFTWWMGF